MNKGEKFIRDMWKNRSQHCYLEMLNVNTLERTILAEFSKVIEAPNWTGDGKYLIYNSDGLLYKYELESSKSTPINTGNLVLCNNDHTLSPDGTQIGFSLCITDNDSFSSLIYTMPLDESEEPRQITPNGPSYLHGWSKFDHHLYYTAERNGQYDIYRIPENGGVEEQLTNNSGLDDGSECDPVSGCIWFNSSRTGFMQVWKMNPDGTEQTQVTDQEKNCWFPHVSPDGKKIVYLAYRKGDLKADEHLPDKKVELRIMNSDGSNDHLLAEFNGGQGTINVNSWSPNSTHIAFVSYEALD